MGTTGGRRGFACSQQNALLVHMCSLPGPSQDLSIEIPFCQHRLYKSTARIFTHDGYVSTHWVVTVPNTGIRSAHTPSHVHV
ncbi:hypothetical protein BCR44DRAFT_1441142 [Catenaria anguillulae PL171]|uniref:Uncharacterized protein n=1 Tax=Catenaria anguillulae PL171 TaxID=765915 RepID=A0A1Y2HBT5_9FUNG|nr:hypothetical protein BCR44DRAFT_1441142 [Catenaria anguillulae PL171]